MNRPLLSFFLFSILSFLFTIDVCAGQNGDSLRQALVKEWQFVSIKDTLGNDVKEISANDILLFSADSTTQRFSYSIQKENISASGLWKLGDNLLMLTYDLKAGTSELDSISYVVVDSKPMIVYYNEGQEVTRLENDMLRSQHKIHFNKIIQLTPESLVYVENGITYSLIHKTSEFVDNISEETQILKVGGISFTSTWRGLLGIVSLLLIAVLFSSNRRAISWSLVGKGLLIQLILAILLLKVPFIADAFEIVSKGFIKILSFTQEGTDFLFRNFVTKKIEMALINFVIQVLPTIIFFAALSSLLYYWGILQKIVYVFAWLMKKVLKLSGAESLAAAGNIFLGQTEAPLLIRPYLDKMTRSELMCLMSGGMATIAGGVLAAYIGFLGGSDPEQQLFYAKHLLTASVMSAPAAIVAAKILVPETEQIDENLKLANDKTGSNALEAIANGTTDGIRLAVNVAGMLLVFIAFIAMANFFLKDIVGYYTGWNGQIASITNGQYDGLTMEFILGLVFAPLSWLLGVCKEDMVLVGQLLGEKTILNEFVAYVSLGEMREMGSFTQEKSIIIATYILCGFANFASIGIQIGGIGSLVPKRKGVLAALGIKALIGGTLASLLTAVIVGMMI